MINTELFSDKRITMAGIARSGIACANLLYKLGAQVSLTDNHDTEAIRKNLRRLKSKNIQVELGRHTREFIKDRDLLVVSPGVPNNAPVIIWAEQFNIPVVSEIEVASSLCPATIIAVTGSNGKTTVTTLIGRILEANLEKVFICGNIGTPFSEVVKNLNKSDFVVLEVSSFQLERISKFKPKISLILNFSANHLDRYSNMHSYFEAKKRIFLNQDESDYLVINQDAPGLRNLAQEAKAKIVYFQETKELNPNQAAVMSVASVLGIEKSKVLKVFREFRGIEHRLEHVKVINNIKFINDSKSTTVESAVWALKNIDNPIIWIAGGRHKGVNYSSICELARKKVKEVILLGEAASIIEGAFKGILSIDRAVNLKEAVIKAYHKAKAGDCVLLSPMCSSFDMFSDYEQRGQKFKEAVYELD